MFYIYCIQNLINNKIYIGKSKFSENRSRWKEHLKIVKTGFTIRRQSYSLIHKAISKHGSDNFLFQIIEEFENEQECLDAEKFWIEFFRSDVNRFGNNYGYNLTAGGDGLSGRKHSIETKEKIRQALLGSTHSAESKLKMSIYRKNVPLWGAKLNQGCKIIWPSDLDLVSLVSSLGLKGTALKLGITDNAVRGRLKRRNLLTKDLILLCKKIKYNNLSKI